MSMRLRILVITAAVAAFVVNLGFYVELQRSDFVQNPVRANYVTLPLGAVTGALVIGTWIAVRRPRAPVGWLLAVAAIATGRATTGSAPIRGSRRSASSCSSPPACCRCTPR